MFLTLIFSIALADTMHAIKTEPLASKPQRNQVYFDPVFGTKIKRLTDAKADGAAGYVCYYSKLEPFNADETRILFYRHQVGHWLIYDMATGNYSRVPQIFNPQTDPQPRWHPTDPDKIRFFSANKIVELELRSKLVTTLATFPEYQFITNHDEGNWSLDGNRIAVCGRNWPWFTGLSEFFVYDLTQGKIISPKVTATGHNVDWVSISPLGKYFVTLNEGDQKPTDISPWPWLGLDVYSAETMQIIPKAFYWYTDHADLGVDINGNEIYVTDNAEDDYPDRLRHMEKYDLETGEKTDLLGMDWSLTRYVSCRNFGGPKGWALITTEAKPELCGKDVPFKDEIFLLKLDGSQQVRRLAHHRSSRYSKCDYSYNQYWDQVNGVISKSGNYVLFTSNWREMGQPQDVYLIDLRTVALAGVKAPNPPANLHLAGYPNPFVESTRIEYRLPDGIDSGTLRIYALDGREILSRELFNSGAITFAPAMSGVYFAKFRFGATTHVLKVMKMEDRLARFR